MDGVCDCGWNSELMRLAWIDVGGSGYSHREGLSLTMESMGQDGMGEWLVTCVWCVCCVLCVVMVDL